MTESLALPRRAAPLPVRLWRIVRASLHLVQGLATIGFVFPWVKRPRREHLIRRWSDRLLRIFAMQKTLAGGVPGHDGTGVVLVANHVSWIDIFVIDSIQPARFIAKAELARWPLIGWLIRGVGTHFIDRSSRRHLHDANRRIADSLARGDVVAIFPEGEVRSELGRFHGSLLQPAIDLQARLQPLAIRYLDHAGEPTTATFYADLNFMQSVWRMTGEPGLQVHVAIAPPLPTAGRDRRELAALAEAFIRAALA